MSGKTLDAFAIRAAASLSRRQSLVVVGGATLAAAVARPSEAHAGKAGKRAKKTCRKQIGKCQTSVATFCANPLLLIGREECEAALLPCCASFKGCKAGVAYDCIVDALLSLVPA